MAVVTMLQNNFVGGEIPSVLQSRSDLAIYYKAVAKSENFIISKEGTLKKRRGVESIMTVAASGEKVRIIPYRYNRTRWGVLRFIYNSTDHLHVRLITDDAVEGPDYLVYNGNLTNAEISGIRAEQIADAFYVTCKNKFNKHILANFAARTLDVQDYTQAPIPEKINYSGTLDAKSTHWTITPSQYKVGKMLNYGVIGVKDSVNSETSKQDVFWEATWSAGQFIDINLTIKASDKAKWDYFILGKRSGAYYGELTRFYMEDDPDNARDANMTVIYKGPDNKYFRIQTVYKWENGKYYNKAEGEEGAVEQFPVEPGYYRYLFRDDNQAPTEVIYGQTNVTGKVFGAPVVVNAFQQRLVFANAKQDGYDSPMTLWFSEIGNLKNFYADRPVSDDDPFQVTLHTTGPSFIRWLITYQRALIAFTDAGIFAIAGSQNEGFSGATVHIERISNMSVSQTVKPIETDDGIVFVGADNKTLYSMAYDLQKDTVQPISRMFFAKHLTRKASITSIALQQFPDTVVWASLSDGTFLSFTFEEAQQVYAWSHHKIEGAKVVEVIGTGTVTDDTSDYTYGDILFIVERDGVRRLARFAKRYTDKIDASEVVVKATAETLRLESQNETIKYSKRTIKDVMIDFVESGPVKVVPVPSDGLIDQIVSPNATMKNPFTGSAKVMPMGAISETGKMQLLSDTATPCEIISVTYKVDIH